MSSNDKPHHDQRHDSLVEQHAMSRLHKVEKEKRKPYVKRPEKFSISHLVIGFLLLIILIVMLISIF